MDDAVLGLFLLALWGLCIVVCARHRTRWTVIWIVVLGKGLGTGAVLQSAVPVAIGVGLYATTLGVAAGDTSPSMIPLYPFLPLVAGGIGAGLNWIWSWLGTVVVVVSHLGYISMSLLRDRREARRQP